MLPVMLLIFIIVPMIEIYFLIEVGSVIGAGWTILAVIATAVIGSWMIKAQGIKTFFNFQQSAAKGEAPTQSIFDGVCLLIAGVSLLMPGFFTDAIGFVLLFPPFRVVLMNYLASKKKFNVVSASHRNYSSGFYHEHRQDDGQDKEASSNNKARHSGRTIESDDYHEINDCSSKND